jgi:hypothetical protein
MTSMAHGDEYAADLNPPGMRDEAEAYLPTISLARAINAGEAA